MVLRWPSAQPVLGTQPIVLRGWLTTDTEAVYQACQDEQLQQFTRVPSPYTMTDAEEFIASGPRCWAAHSDINYAITDTADEVIGAIALMHIDDENRLGEIGYWVADFARGQRVARRAVELLSGWARDELGIVRFILKIERENTPSIAAALAAGARPTGTTVDEELRGSMRNYGIYEIV